jgi:hypothetical protein
MLLSRRKRISNIIILAIIKNNIRKGREGNNFFDNGKKYCRRIICGLLCGMTLCIFQVFGPLPEFLIITGNHDFRNHAHKTMEESRQLFMKSMKIKYPDTHDVINGYSFIRFNSDSGLRTKKYKRKNNR